MGLHSAHLRRLHVLSCAWLSACRRGRIRHHDSEERTLHPQHHRGVPRTSGSHHPFLPPPRTRLGQPARGAEGGSGGDGGAPEHGAPDLSPAVPRASGIRHGCLPARLPDRIAGLLRRDQGKGAEDRRQRSARHLLCAVVGSSGLSAPPARGASHGDLALSRDARQAEGSRRPARRLRRQEPASALCARRHALLHLDGGRQRTDQHGTPRDCRPLDQSGTPHDERLLSPRRARHRTSLRSEGIHLGRRPREKARARLRYVPRGAVLRCIERRLLQEPPRTLQRRRRGLCLGRHECEGLRLYGEGSDGCRRRRRER